MKISHKKLVYSAATIAAVAALYLILSFFTNFSIGGYNPFLRDKFNNDFVPCNSIYHWKTQYNPTEYEKQWLAEHNVQRIYIKMFDVDAVRVGDDYDIQPTSTTSFTQSLAQEGIEYVPTIYMTHSALIRLNNEQDIETIAGKILKRTLNMADYYDFPTLKEMQIDCDWTNSSQDAFFCLCRCLRDSLHQRHIRLSSTIRLHQLRTDAPPVDRGVLMLYNVSDIKDYHTTNSIIDPQRIEDYLQHYRYNLPLSIAVPTFSWGAWFRNGRFGCILHQTNYQDTTYYQPIGNNRYLLTQDHLIEDHWLYAGDEIRVENCAADSIIAVKNMLPSRLKKAEIVIYHLDSTNLSKYTHDEISKIYHTDL